MSMPSDEHTPSAAEGDSLPMTVSERLVGNDLIPTTDARRLHAFLGNGDKFATWIADRIRQYEFVEQADFVTFSEKPEKGRPTKEYAISLDMAKELAMVERSERGKQARRYFIACERRVIDQHSGAIVQGIDRNVMGAIGGMVKGIVAKALAELAPAALAGQIASGHYSIARGLTAGEVLDEAGVTNRKGLRGLSRRVSDHLRRFHATREVATPLKTLGTSSAYVFDVALVREWLLNGGRQTIQRWIEERRGQGALKLVAGRDG